MRSRPWLTDRQNARGIIIVVVAVAALVLAGTLVAVASPLMLALAGGAAALSLVALVSEISPRAAVGLVFGASTLSGLVLPTPIGLLRMDQAIVLPALCGVLAKLASDRGGTSRVDRASPLIALTLGLYVLANFGSTVLTALDVISSLRVVLWLSLSFAAYLLTVTVAARFCPVGTLLDDVVSIGTAASGAAIALYCLAVLGLSSFGVQTDPSTGQLVAKGAFHEGNLLGSFSAMTAILGTSQLIHSHGRTSRRRALLLVSVAVCVAGTYLSFTRAAWLGFAAAAVVILLVSRPRLGRTGVIVPGSIVFAVAGVFLLVSGAGTQLADRVLSIFTDSTGTIAFRAANFSLALAGVTDHLWLGLGTNSFGQHILDPTQDFSRGYIGGLFIATLWDVGLLGLTVLLMAFATVARKLWQGLASSEDAARSQAAGFSAAFVCALVAYQGTNGFWFAYNWILVGLAASIPVGLAIHTSSDHVRVDAVRPIGLGPSKLREGRLGGGRGEAVAARLRGDAIDG